MDCPICPNSSLDTAGKCASCGREWYEKDGCLMSRIRKVVLTGFPKEGQRLDDFIKPIEPGGGE